MDIALDVALPNITHVHEDSTNNPHKYNEPVVDIMILHRKEHCEWDHAL
jgi:hypothetical protein